MIKRSLAAVFLALSTQALASELPKTPEQLIQATTEAFNTNNIDLMMKLYDQDSLFIPAPGKVMNTPETIKASLTQFLSLRMTFKGKIRQVYTSGQTALMIQDWTLSGKDAKGKPTMMKGTSTDIIQQRADGTWYYRVDNPFGINMK